MKNPYVQATLRTLAFVLYVIIMAVGFVYLKDAVGTETASQIVFGALGLFGIVVIFMINLARARFYSKD